MAYFALAFGTATKNRDGKIQYYNDKSKNEELVQKTIKEEVNDLFAVFSDSDSEEFRVVERVDSIPFTNSISWDLESVR